MNLSCVLGEGPVSSVYRSITLPAVLWCYFFQTCVLIVELHQCSDGWHLCSSHWTEFHICVPNEEGEPTKQQHIGANSLLIYIL